VKTLLRNYGVWIAAAILFAVLPLVFTSGFALTLLCKMGVLIIFAIAYNMLLGQGGMLSFGHAIYFGLGGYCSIHILNGMLDGGLPYFPVSLFPIIGAIVGLLMGVVIGYVSTRRAGTTFAMISLGFGEMVTAMTLIFVAFFNGEDGIQADRWVGPEPFGITYGPQIQVYYLIAIWCFIAMVTMYAITKTPFGRMSNAVRDNPERAEFVGYNTQRVRWLAFSLSAMFAGAAGSLHALNYENIGFESVSAIQSGAVLFMVYIGGIGHFLGPIIGTVLMVFLDSTLSDHTEAWLLYLGIVFVVIVMTAPGGLAGIIVMHQPVWRTDIRLLWGLALPYSLAILSSVILAIGIIGIIEMIYFITIIALGEAEMHLFGIPINVNEVTPWLACLVIIGVGVQSCRMSYPRVVESWDKAMLAVKARIAG
jgi:branched-chain amino acid transport system permease protein